MRSDYSELQFNVQFDETPEENVPFQVVVFERSGNITYQAPVNEKSFSLPFTADDLRGKRIFLAPYSQDRKTSLSLDTLEKGNGFEVSIPSNIDDEKLIVLNPIPKYIWCWWLFCFCNVRGRVFNLCDHEYKPVYKARVHICEVDPVIWYIQKLPDYEIFKLRDDLLAKIIDWHLPDPPPDPLRNIDINAAAKFNTIQKNLSQNPRSLEINKASFAAADKNITAAKSNTTQKEFTANTANVQFDKSSLTTAGKTIALSVLPQENLVSFYSDSAYLVRNYLVANYQILYPYWCWLYPWFLRCDEVAVVETDTNGWFNAAVWYACCGDKPDLYFWVEYFINGAWTTVYNPGLHCGTHWDYVCNTEVDIYLNDQRIPCPALPTVPGNKVVVTTLGSNVNVNRVNQTGGADFGLAPDLGYGAGKGPFLGSVEPHVFFGDGLIASGIRYYRWRFKLHSAADVDANWKNMNESVDRYYFHESPDSFPRYNLGPKIYQPGTSIALINADLFEIQTPNVLVPGTNYWYALNPRTDTATGYFKTLDLNTVDINGHTVYADDLYDLKLEFFDETGTQVTLSGAGGTGTQVEVPDAGKVAPFIDPIVDAVAAPLVNQLLDTSGNLLGFKMTIRVDNHPTSALIHETTVGMNAAGECGMIPYNNVNDLAHIAFEAFHPNDFAYFDFTIYKGSSGVVHQVAGNVSNIPAVTVYNRTAPVSAEPYTYTGSTDEFDADKHVGTLLETCIEAAFSEVLNVRSAATDGWDRTGYDSGDVKAFSLKHE